MMDSALFSWLLSSIGPSVLPSLVNRKTASDIWEKIHHLFSVSSTTKIMHFHCSLKTLNKHNQSIPEYLAQIHVIYNSFVACDNPLTATMHISAILFGLPLEFEPMSVSVNMVQGSTHNWSSLRKSPLDNPSGFFQLGKDGQNQFSGQNYYPNYSMAGSSGMYGVRSTYSSHRSSQDQGFSQGSYASTNYRVTDELFGEPVTQHDSIHGDLETHDVNTVIVADGFGTIGYEDTTWYLDSGATTPLTPDAGMVLDSAPYIGPGKVSVTNGKNIPISKIGQAILPSQSRSLV
ncbi:uncharacterized protein LOC120115193 [Hibiscus syriacus]|uniref:uncharacterized protein LOC120115193 n=1 Tax=Hibiscus syriacus TaxID=106335 RepID=UPI001923A6F4|nr:uncharacterized protein LOC120115193 [Hibiscus syriacus]